MSDPADVLPHKVEKLVWDKDVDRFIEEKLGRTWCLQQNGEYGQETRTVYEVFVHDIEEYQQEARDRVAAWLASPPCKCPGRQGQPDYGESVPIYTTDILAVLCEQGHLPEGDLVIHVWW